MTGVHDRSAGPVAIHEMRLADMPRQLQDMCLQWNFAAHTRGIIVSEHSKRLTEP